MGKNETVETITVERKSKYGVLYNDVWYNIGKNAKVGTEDLTVDNFELKKSYNVFVSPGKNGAKYINGLPESATNEIVKTEVPKAVVKKPADEAMTRADWDAKDRRISMQGLVQAVYAVQGDAEKAWSEAAVLYRKLWGKDFE